MINCITKHGCWRVIHRKGQIVKTAKQHSKADFDGFYKRLICVNQQTFFHSADIKFYDNNGFYTGFRLKSLK